MSLLFQINGKQKFPSSQVSGRFDRGEVIIGGIGILLAIEQIVYGCYQLHTLADLPSQFGVE
jgi:hypothetical protein